MQSTTSLPSLQGFLWFGMVAPPEMVFSMSQKELFDIQTNDLCEIELLKMELFHHLTVCKQMTDVK